MRNSGLSAAAQSIADEFQAVQLGDARLHERVRRIVTRLSESPGESLPDAMKTDAELEGLYRLLGNKRVAYGALVRAHAEQTVERMAGHRTVRAVHDTTEFEFDGEVERKGLGPLRGRSEARGFFAHATLAVAEDAVNLPLGLIGLECWARTSSPRSGQRKKKLNGGDYARIDDKESTRWARQVEEVERTVEGRCSLVHVMDREADAYPLLSAMSQQGRRFVVRVARDRLVWELDDQDEPLEDIGLMPLSEALGELPIKLEREVALSKRRASSAPRQGRAHPDRHARPATLGISATRLALRRPPYLSEQMPHELGVNLVVVRELDAPAGQEPVAWVLATNEPIQTKEQIAAVVDHYRARWLIEEFFKALKTGCSFETRQLESFESLTNALALFVPIAWQMLQLRALSRLRPNAPADEVLNPAQTALLRQFQPKKMPTEGATVRDALYAVAGLGGHLKQNGAPGWQTLARGMQTLLTLEAGWNAAAEISRQTMGKM
ncbi:IS4 family transposase [Sorangium sp. So ce385]|uniref:IS4 family transposase n=1 Tax=Sorangium sp. So ce385 TaxID=3133308 RepID=UPI003F5B43C7